MAITERHNVSSRRHENFFRVMELRRKSTQCCNTSARGSRSFFVQCAQPTGMPNSQCVFACHVGRDRLKALLWISQQQKFFDAEISPRIIPNENSGNYPQFLSTPRMPKFCREGPRPGAGKLFWSRATQCVLRFLADRIYLNQVKIRGSYMYFYSCYRSIRA